MNYYPRNPVNQALIPTLKDWKLILTVLTARLALSAQVNCQL